MDYFLTPPTPDGLSGIGLQTPTVSLSPAPCHTATIPQVQLSKFRFQFRFSGHTSCILNTPRPRAACGRCIGAQRCRRPVMAEDRTGRGWLRMPDAGPPATLGLGTDGPLLRRPGMPCDPVYFSSANTAPRPGNQVPQQRLAENRCSDACRTPRSE